MTPPPAAGAPRRVSAPLVLAAVAGIVHGAFSLYWAADGDWLLATVGQRMIEEFADARWLLVPVGLVKVTAALAPAMLAATGWPLRRLSRLVCWAGATVLLAWGGAGMVIAPLVLAGAIDGGDGFDRMGMIGHAWLWDPLFVLWGAALVVGLVRTRGSVRG